MDFEGVKFGSFGDHGTPLELFDQDVHNAMISSGRFAILPGSW
jgi:hypothetical protein